MSTWDWDKPFTFLTYFKTTSCVQFSLSHQIRQLYSSKAIMQTHLGAGSGCDTTEWIKGRQAARCSGTNITKHHVRVYLWFLHEMTRRDIPVAAKADGHYSEAKESQPSGLDHIYSTEMLVWLLFDFFSFNFISLLSFLPSVWADISSSN